MESHLIKKFSYPPMYVKILDAVKHPNMPISL